MFPVFWISPPPSWVKVNGSRGLEACDVSFDFRNHPGFTKGYFSIFLGEMFAVEVELWAVVSAILTLHGNLVGIISG